jgi:archaellum component FlaC
MFARVIWRGDRERFSYIRCRDLAFRAVLLRMHLLLAMERTKVMFDTEPEVAERSASGMLFAAIAVACLLGVGALIWCYGLQNHITAAEQKLVEANKRTDALNDEIATTRARLSATTETLSQNVGATQKQIDARADAIMATQKAQNAATVRLAQQQQVAEKQIGVVSNDVASVKTDVGGVKTDVATTRSDLETTKSQLQRVVGDAGVMSGLIATNHDELEQLKHKGDRNYIEFTLQKGAKPTLISTITIQLKKVDNKHGRYTLNVSSDDRNIEKKDKNLDEPVQFYTGKNPVLFELVVNDIEKNEVSGYLSTPKGTP